MSGFNTPRGQRRYRCRRPRWQIAEIDTPFCRGGVNADWLESQVWTAVEDGLNDPKWIAAEIARQHEHAGARHRDLERETQLLTAAVARCDRDLQRWEAAYLGEAITLEDFKAKKAEVDARKDSLLAERSRLEEQAKQLEYQRVEVASLVDYCRLVRTNLATFDIHDKRKALEALRIVVTWKPGTPPQIQGSIPMDATAAPLHTAPLELQ
jgi:hypothetical protein